MTRISVLAAVLLGLVASSCSDGGPSEIERTAASIAAAAYTTEPSTAPLATTATTGAPSVPASTSVASTLARVTPPTGAPAGLSAGARGAEVAALESRLDALRYDVGAVNDVFDENTAYGVMAFQKVNGMARTGRATDDVIAALATAKAPAALVPTGGADRVEVDIPRQVLFLYKAGALAKILTMSSGNNQRFCSEGRCRQAVTPGGSFAFYRQGKGWEYGPLGGLYNPAYFNGGIAIHGSKSVPAQPASHGCVRIPMAAAEWFPSQISIGMAVHVYGVDGQPPTPEARTSPTTTTAVPVSSPPTTAAPVTATTAPGLLGGLLKSPI